MSQSTRNKTRENVMIAVFAAIIILQTWVPFLGYISLPTLSLTIVHITVIVVTIILGMKAGAIIGTIWGINSLLRAVFVGNPLERLIFMSPLVSILPRLLMPICVALLDKLLKRTQLSDKVRAGILGFTGSLLNTIFVLGAIGIFRSEEYLSLIGSSSDSNIWQILMAVVTVNGIPEAIVATFLTPLIVTALSRFLKR